MARTFPTRRKGIKMSDLRKEFTEDEVAAWLKTHGLAVLVSRFKDNYIDGKVLMSITYKDCVEMIPEIGLRRKLLELLPQVPEQNKGNTQEVTSQEVEANPSTSQSLQADVLQSSTMTFVPPGWKRGGKIPSPVPLPKLSAPLEMDIALGKLGRNQQTDCDFIAEAGRFYTSLCSELGNDYGRIAVALVDKYPALRDRTGDKHATVKQRLCNWVRNQRRKYKNLYYKDSSGLRQYGVKRTLEMSTAGPASVFVQDDQAYEGTIAYLKNLLKDGKRPGMSQVKTALQETHVKRRAFMKNTKESVVTILDQHSYLGQQQCMLYEFKLIVGSEVYEDILLRWKQLCFAICNNMSGHGSSELAADDGEDRDEPEYSTAQQLDMIAVMESEVATKKVYKLVKEVTVNDDLEEIIKEASVPEPLPLVVIEEGKIKQASLIAEKRKIIDIESTLSSHVLVIDLIVALLAVYYVLDISFPTKNFQ